MANSAEVKMHDVMQKWGLNGLKVTWRDEVLLGALNFSADK